MLPLSCELDENSYCEELISIDLLVPELKDPKLVGSYSEGYPEPFERRGFDPEPFDRRGFDPEPFERRGFDPEPFERRGFDPE